MDFEEYRKAQRNHWKGMLKDCENRLRKALFPEKLTKEFYESRYFKENGVDCTRLGEDYWMYLEIALNSYKYNLEYCNEQLAKLDRLTEEQWKSETRQLFRNWHQSEWESKQWDVRDKYHAFKA